MSVVEIHGPYGRVEIAYTPDDVRAARSWREQYGQSCTYKRLPGFPYDFDNAHVVRAAYDISPYADGGYPLAYYPAKVRTYRDKHGEKKAHAETIGDGPFCADCVRKHWDADVDNRETYHAEVEHGSESGLWCEGCGAVILYPCCQSCYDVADTAEEFAAYIPRDDCGFLCPNCAGTADPDA